MEEDKAIPLHAKRVVPLPSTMGSEPNPKPWKPDRPVSKGASAYHDAVIDAPYYINALDALIDIVVPKIKENDIVVDFGAGTGVSALRLLKSLKVPVRLWLVDNSPAWLGKAYEIFKSKDFVECYPLEKRDEHYSLSQTVGKGLVDHVISGNTVHLIEDIEYAFKGVHESLKDDGIFSFQSANIITRDLPKGALMLDDTVRRVHEIAIDMIKNDAEFAEYKKDIDERMKKEEPQRKFVFPDPRSIEFYVDALKKTGFADIKYYFELSNVKYSDWLNFLRVRRLQAGILPEIGGNNPTEKEEHDRDTLITKATKKLFKELEESNPMADSSGFTIFFVYVTSRKIGKMESAVGLILKGKTALVTGASRGIGRAIAIELARQGADVVVNYSRDEKGAYSVVQEIKKMGRKSIAVKADVSDFDQVRKMFEAVSREFSRLDILINNAGIIIDKTLQNMGIEEWSNVVNINLNGVFNSTRNALPLIKSGGRIISISSIVGIDGNFGQTNYAASKAGIIGFTKSLAKEVGKHGITVNAIAPGFIETEILKSIPHEKKKSYTSLITLGRMGTPADVAKVVVFLTSDRSSYITGEVIRVDGGLKL